MGMRIAFDVTSLQNEHKRRGTGSYTKNLIEALQKYEKKYSYTFFVRGENIPKDVDLVHYPYFDPFFLTLPPIKYRPTVVTVHDLIPLIFPDKFPAGIKGQFKWLIQRVSLSGCRAIITDSETSKRDIKHIMGINETLVHAIPLAPAPWFMRITSDSQLSNVKIKHSLPDNFILYVGDVNWNKNVIGMLKAFQKLRTQNPELRTKLVLIGRAFKNNLLAETKDIDQNIHLLKITEDVIKLGFVPDEDLPAIYSLASVYVQPSFYEGFGLPVLEAIACGCPTVVSNTPALLEIAGPSITVKPEDPSDIARGITEALKLKKRDWQEKTPEWVKKFSWEKVASQTISVYKQVLSK